MRNDPIDPTGCHECNGSGVYEDHDGATRTCSRCGGWDRASEPCRLGYEEHDGSRYCFAHFGFAHFLMWGDLLCRGGDRP